MISQQTTHISMTSVAATRTDSLGVVIANSASHGVGVVLSIVGTSILVGVAVAHGTMWQIVSCAIYGTTLVLLYVFSTLYHALPGRRAKYVFRIFDHSSIFLLIAGTYTPFTLVTLHGGWRWTLFTIVWLLSACGVVFKSLWVDRFPIISSVVYILMGWLVIIGIKPLLNALPGAGFAWLLAGGLFYTFGVFFFASKKIPYGHAIWHLFVLAGSFCHYWAVLDYVLPRTRR